jgi:hypothetical protein
MAIGYTKTASNMYPGIFVTGRNSGDPAGTLQSEVQLRAGQLPYDDFLNPPHRWGDYTGMTNDPNGRDFWYLGQYSKNAGHPNTRWGTYIGCFQPSSCFPPQSPSQQFTNSQITIPLGVEPQQFIPIIHHSDPPPVLPCGYSISPIE